MTLSVCINTVAGSPHSKHVMSSSDVPYSLRGYALQQFILPSYVTHPMIDEVVIVGQWHAGEGYLYIKQANKYHNWMDCVQQRQVAFERSSGDILVFQHDDHILEPRAIAIALQLFKENPEIDVLSPARFSRVIEFEGREINSGQDDGYIDGHCAFYKRAVIEKCPWKDVPLEFTLDMYHTMQIVNAGFKIGYSKDVFVWDVEPGAIPWQ